ncbi:hypothetical protein ROLI_048500 (plasmid) [Roseobacter fucihabitans]|uniref:Uncharacterized protein n=1 Tax=Roseobacter fucihabitans TaxID=1537242 RepID=A0ABZ2C127_9RHOB|nr:hypothetical protein [Roseobacter litoralis]
MQRTYLSILAIVWAGVASAQEVSLGSYLTSMDRTSVTFSGRIKYNSSEGDFTFYDENREPFGVTIDAGRDARERIETECNNTSFMVSYDDLCTISGSGTVEIRGSRVYISVEQVNQLNE